MLGMLMCAVLLLFCGLWECCFRLPKQEAENGQSTPVAAAQSHQNNNNNPQPPQYDDLDQPPSYYTLFPNVKSNLQQTDPHPCVINVQECVPSDSSNRSDDAAVETVQETTIEPRS